MKLRQKGQRFPYVPRPPSSSRSRSSAQRNAIPWADDPSPVKIDRRRSVCESLSPMFVPSLSWRNDQLSHTKGAKQMVSGFVPAARGGSRRGCRRASPSSRASARPRCACRRRSASRRAAGQTAAWSQTAAESPRCRPVSASPAWRWTRSTCTHTNTHRI